MEADQSEMDKDMECALERASRRKSSVCRFWVLLLPTGISSMNGPGTISREPGPRASLSSLCGMALAANRPTGKSARLTSSPNRTSRRRRRMKRSTRR